MWQELWSDKKRSQAQKLIDALVEQTSDSGIPVSWVTTVAEEELLAMMPESMAVRRMVVGALQTMHKSGYTAVEDFERIYTSGLRKRQETTESTTEWTFFVPLAIRAESNLALPRQFEFLGRLKLACEQALEWVLRVRHCLPAGSHLEQYYRYHSRGDSDLNCVRNTLDFIQLEERGKSPK